ncbi:MAG: M20/M25/M40 family metallo-hydrolase [Planctomycetota bacterium]
MRRRLALALAALLLGTVAPRAVVAEDAAAEPAEDFLAGFTGEAALAHAKALADDAMLGRRSGFEGGRRAETWMVSKISELGLDPMDRGGAYLEPFVFAATAVAPPIELKVEGEAVEYGTQFVDLNYTGTGAVEAEVVFVGYGISAPDRGWDDYDGLDVKGKIVLALRGAPAARESEFGVERQIGAKSSVAADRGAVGFLVAEGEKAVQGTIQSKFHREKLPAVWVAGAVADRVLAKRGRTLADLKASRDKGEPGRSFGTGVTVRLEVNGKHYPHVQANNVIGGIRGRDPDLRNEVVLVGAHLDHLGTDATGRVFNGADDNASGSATLLALVETLVRNRWRPARTIVFVWFGAEEQGLEGSRALVADLPFAHKAVVAMLNLDMTGQGKPEVSLGGGEGYPHLYDLAASACPAPYAATLAPFRVEGNSDHWPFYERGIPALFAHSAGDHPNYHQVADDAVNLKPECLEAVGRVVGAALVKLGSHPEPLATGREAAGLVLRESPRVVEGPESAAALAVILAGKKDAPADRSALVKAGRACVVAALDEKDGGAAVAWARLARGVDGRRDVTFVRTAPDLVNAARGGRTAVLPRLACPVSAAAFPPVLSTYRDLGLRWVAPFDGASMPKDDVRDAIVDAALEAKLVVDLTGLDPDAYAAVRARLGDAPATVRVTAPLAPEPAASAAALAALRTRLGPKTLLLLSGGAGVPLFAPEALRAADDPAAAPVAIVAEDTPRLEGILAVPADEHASYADPDSKERARLRALFGGSFVDLLRRVP